MEDGVFEAAQSNKNCMAIPKAAELGFFLLIEEQKMVFSTLEIEKSLPFGGFFRIYDMQKA